MKETKKAQILLPSVTLGAVLSMSGIASASQTEYMQTKVPGTNAIRLSPGGNDNGNDNDKDKDKNKKDNIDIDINIDIDADSDHNGDKDKDKDKDNGNGNG
jgi:hypothetical protein